MARYVIVLAVILSLTPVVAAASQVLAITNNGEQVTVQYEAASGQRWKLNDDICLYQGKTELLCGYVGRLTAAEIVVQVTQRSYVPRGGQAVQLRRDSRTLASAQIQDTVGRTEAPLIDATVGMNAGLNYFYPTASVQVAIARVISLGVQPLYMNFTSSGVDVKAFGGFFNVSYYHTHYPFRGLVFQGGVGFYDVQLKQTGFSEKITPLAFQGQVQWRGKAHFALGIDIGVGLGVLYVVNQPTTTLKNNFSGLLPLFNLYVGYSF